MTTRSHLAATNVAGAAALLNGCAAPAASGAPGGTYTGVKQGATLTLGASG